MGEAGKREGAGDGGRKGEEGELSFQEQRRKQLQSSSTRGEIKRYRDETLYTAPVDYKEDNDLETKKKKKKDEKRSAATTRPSLFRQTEGESEETESMLLYV